MSSPPRRGFLRNRSFRDYLAMNVSSSTAGQVGNLAVIWYVFAVTHSPIEVTVVGASQTLAAVVVSLPAGVWVDRHDRRRLLLLANLVRAGSLFLLATMTATFGLSLVGVVAIVFAWNGATELYRSADYSSLPDLVAPDEVTDANGLTRSSYMLASSASNFIGGAIVAFVGATFAFAYGAVGYAVAACFSAFLFLRFRTHGTTRAADAPRPKMGSQTREGFRWLWTQKGLFQLSLSAAVFNFLASIPGYFIVVYVSVALKADALTFGAVLASYVIGRAVGSLSVGRTNALAYAGRAWVLMYGVLSGALVMVQGAFPNAEVAVVANLVMGIGTGFAGNVWLTSAQHLVPSEMRGRYFAIDGLLSFLGGPPAVVAGGLLVAAYGILPVYDVVGALLLVSGLAFAAMKELSMLDGRPRQRVSAGAAEGPAAAVGR
ncbi:MAG: MFS transporter [Nitrososphaerota archaeon]|nr:MFS transporter [Nitrososphaerota archaeon]